MENQIFIILIISCIRIKAQCITSNDSVNETSIEIAARNLIEGRNKFGLDLLQVLNDEQRLNNDSAGIFFSPYSIWSALLITYMGSRGDTEHEMKMALRLGDADKVTIWEAFRNIMNSNSYNSNSYPQNLHNMPPSSSYQSVNKVYFQEGTSFKYCMKELLQNDIAFVDFANQSAEARETINTYVEEQTQNRIKNLIPPNGIGSLTRMVIANAVYFKETGQNQFDPLKTVPRKFTTPSRKDIFVPMMSTRGRFLYGHSEELSCHVLELTNNRLSMLILLPINRYYGMDILIKSLTSQNLRNLVNDMYPREVSVQIPKFKVEANFELSTILQRLGVSTLFNLKRVDLSGFTGQREFSLDAVFHKTFINFNEEATTDGTAIITSREKLPMIFFVADCPFIYLIRDNLLNSILFFGTVQNPTIST